MVTPLLSVQPVLRCVSQRVPVQRSFHNSSGMQRQTRSNNRLTAFNTWLSGATNLQLHQHTSRRLATGGRPSRPRGVGKGNHERGSLQERRRLKKSKDKTTGKEIAKAGGKGQTKADSNSKAKFTPWKEDPTKYKDYQKVKYTAMAQRAAPLVVFGLIINITDEGSTFFHNYLFPLQMEQLYGPSMVPSIHPYGDAWLHTTPMWDSVRSVYHKLKSLVSQTPSLMYQKGDIVIWRDPDTNRRACKRIVGVEGDTVQRYGQFAEYYAHREDVGVPWESGLGERGLDPSCPWDDQGVNADGFPENDNNNTKDDNDIYRTLVVPEGHVWLEGDNPLLSVDSRHYGPIPVAYLEGRLVWRLWPLLRHPAIRKHDQLLLRHRAIRPQPLDLETPKQRGQEDRLALYYNLHRRPPPPPSRRPDSADGEEPPVMATEQ